MITIKVDKISKLYQLGATRHNSLRDTLMSLLTSGSGSGPRNELWALKDVSFEVSDGETLAIIGRNGAGKSTLLKILSRITKPTSGTAEIRGRVGSLLEVGTGFHNELSGRENIFLNGAILGMKRTEIEARFDEIVAFSEIEKFVDTPVKHYSSGMYMRLAFSVAAHLEPEILIVDEVLAVGDVAFQKKCLNKMRDVGQIGRTVLFVSHDMQAVSRLCDRSIWMKDGTIVRDGETSAVVSEYLHEQSQTGSERTWDDPKRSPGNETTRLRRVRICNENRETTASVDIRKPVAVEITYEVLQKDKVLQPTFQLYDEQGTCAFISFDQEITWLDRPRPKGTYVSTAWIPGNFLSEGSHFVTVVMATFEPLVVHLVEREVVTFNVFDGIAGDSARGKYTGVMIGAVRPILNWETEFNSRSFEI